jgi:hypothetical protein
MGRIRMALVWAGVLAALGTPAQAQTLKEFGSFHVGGRSITLSGYPVTEAVFTKGAAPTKVDPNGDFEVEQMYVQYLIPEPQQSKYPLLMWHGGGLTGVTWDTKPDGKPGFMQYFFRHGHAIFHYFGRNGNPGSSFGSARRNPTIRIQRSASRSPVSNSRSRPSTSSPSKSCRAGRVTTRLHSRPTRRSFKRWARAS